MSGGSDDFNTTLQAIACADVIQKSGIPVIILLSGGTNSKTGKLARMCHLNVHGVSIGTFARKLVREEIEILDFESNYKALKLSLKKAKYLVENNIRYTKRY